MFGVQAIYDNMNQLNCHLSTSGTCWTQELPVNHTEWHKIAFAEFLLPLYNCGRSDRMIYLRKNSIV